MLSYTKKKKQRVLAVPGFPFHIFLIYIMVNFKHTKLEAMIEGNTYMYNLGSTMINSGKQC